ncbi:MAG: SMI1/KNR4 family protein [Proteobacteria bacterium]|nr:SMI1/KNR4 family protein [Pseudomonadota bacterium]MBU4294695.1 SMI1/KNR4 family protein [Pseudomonadota bacterium]MCG2749780.1 SMI1/KNR4 family protein [Desulfobulbaceae bacterium]
MSKLTPEDMRQALKRGAEIRNRYFYDETDPVSALHDGASDAEILDLEASIGYQLPPSYRLFLSISNGWDFVDAHVSLISSHDIKNSFENKEFAKWYDDMEKHGLDYPKNVVVIGTSDITEAKYLLVVPDVNAGKKEFELFSEEWPVMYLSASSDFVYKDFWDFLNKSEEMYKELVEDEDL